MKSEVVKSEVVKRVTTGEEAEAQSKEDHDEDHNFRWQWRRGPTCSHTEHSS